jgi:hypothetical protein
VDSERDRATQEVEEEEGFVLFRADAVNEEDPERDRTTQVYSVEDLFRALHS